MGRVSHFLCEDVTGIDLTRDVEDLAGTGLVLFTNLVFAEVKMFDALGGARGGPLNTGCIVVEDFGGGGAVDHAQVNSSKLDRCDFFDAFVGGENFSFA
jgi:hypothetical protein